MHPSLICCFVSKLFAKLFCYIARIKQNPSIHNNNNTDDDRIYSTKLNSFPRSMERFRNKVRFFPHRRVDNAHPMYLNVGSVSPRVAVGALVVTLLINCRKTLRNSILYQTHRFFIELFVSRTNFLPKTIVV